MASPKQSRGLGPPDPADDVALQQPAVLRGEREETVAMTLCPAAPVTTTASRLWCKASLVLAICLSATVLLYNPSSLPALGSLAPSPVWLGPAATQQGTGDGLVATDKDLPKQSAGQQGRSVLMSAPSCLPEVEGVVTRGTDVEGWSLGMLTTSPASPLAAWTSPQQQAGSRHGEGLSMGTAVAVTQWLGTGASATSDRLLQTMGVPSADSQLPLALGTLPGTGPGLHDATQEPAVTSARGLGQPVGTAEPHSPGTPVPAHEGTLAGTLSQSHSIMDQPGGAQMLALGSLPDHQTVPCRADVSPAVSSESPPVVTARDVPSWSRAVTAAQAPSSVPAPDLATAGVQHGAPVPRATERSHNVQEEEVRPSPGQLDLGMGKDHTAVPCLVPLPEGSSALPTERASNSTIMHPGTDWIPSTVTPEMSWETQPAGAFLHALAKVSGNRSGLLATLLASPSTVVAHDVTHPQVLASTPPAAEARGPAVTSGKATESSPSAQQTLPTSTEAYHSPAWTRVPSTASPTGVSLAPPDAIPEPGVTEVPCKNGAGVVASPEEPRTAGVTHGFPLESPTQRPLWHPEPFLMTAPEHGPTAGQGQAMKETEMSMQPGQVAVAAEAGHSEPRTASAGSPATPAEPPEPTHASPASVPPPNSNNPALECCFEGVQHTSTTSLPSPPYLLPSAVAVSAASSDTLAVPAVVTLSAQPMARPFTTSQHPSTAGAQPSSASGEAFTRTGLVTVAKSGSLELKPSAPHLARVPSQLLPTHVLPFQFRLVGIAYSEALSNPASESYRELEEEVRLLVSAGGCW